MCCRLICFILTFCVPFCLLAEEKKVKGAWLEHLDFHVGSSLDFAYTQTPLHYLSYLEAGQKGRLPEDLRNYFKDSSKTVSNGIGFGVFCGLGFYFQRDSFFSFGLEYQFSTAGSEASNLTYTEGSLVKSLSLMAGYFDHRLRLYTKVTPHLIEKGALSFNILLGMSIIQLRNLKVCIGDKIVYSKLSSLRYADGSPLFGQNAYAGLDIGLRASFYMLDIGFDLALTSLFVIPRFSVGCSFNKATFDLLFSS